MKSTFGVYYYLILALRSQTVEYCAIFFTDMPCSHRHRLVLQKKLTAWLIPPKHLTVIDLFEGL